MAETRRVRERSGYPVAFVLLLSLLQAQFLSPATSLAEGIRRSMTQEMPDGDCVLFEALLVCRLNVGIGRVVVDVLVNED